MDVDQKTGKLRESRTKRKASRTQQRLVSSALALFKEKGTGATTIEDITERADVGKGTFYRHFRNKEALFAALTGDATDHLIAMMRAPEGKTETPQEMVERLVNAHSTFFRNEPVEAALLVEGTGLKAMLRGKAAENDEPRKRYFKALEAEIARAGGGASVAAVAQATGLFATLVPPLFLAVTEAPDQATADKAVATLRRACIATVIAAFGQ